MNLDWVMDRLYREEINCSLESFFDRGWHVRLGDEANGWKAEAWVATVSDAAEWLWRETCRLYPMLDFLGWVKDGCDFGLNKFRLERLATGCEEFAAYLRNQVKMRDA